VFHGGTTRFARPLARSTAPSAASPAADGPQRPPRPGYRPSLRLQPPPRPEPAQDRLPGRLNRSGNRAVALTSYELLWPYPIGQPECIAVYGTINQTIPPNLCSFVRSFHRLVRSRPAKSMTLGSHSLKFYLRRSIDRFGLQILRLRLSYSVPEFSICGS